VTYHYLLTFLAAFLATASCAYALPNIDKLADAEKFQEVIAVCDKAIRKDPKDAKAYGIRSWANCRLERYPKAIEDSSTAIKLDRNYARAYRYRAYANYELKKYGDSIVDCNKAISLDPTGDQCAYWTRGMAHHYLHQSEKAISDLSAAIALSKQRFPEYFGDRGILFQCAEKYEEAIKDFDTLLTFHSKGPWAVWAHWQKGQTFRFKGDSQRSIESCNTALSQNPKYSDAYLTKAWAHYKLQQYDLAVSAASKAIDSDPSNYHNYVCRGDAYWTLRNSEAIADLRKAAELSNSAERYEFLAFCCADFNRHKERVEALTKAIEIELKCPSKVQPSFAKPLGTYFYCRGISRHNIGQFAQAIDDFNNSITVHSRFSVEFAYYRRARSNLALGHIEEALRDCDQAALGLVGDDRIYELRAEIHEKQGQFELASSERILAELAEYRCKLACWLKSSLALFELK